LGDPLGGGLPPENCHTVLSRDNPQCPPRTGHRPPSEEPRKPIQDEIDAAFQAISQQIGRGKGRRLYVYFSGHGLGRDTIGADLCTAKWSKDWRNAALDSEDYQNKIISSGYFREVVLLLDCCRVREVDAKGLGASFGWPMSRDRALAAGQVRTFIGFATEFANPAREAVVAGATDDEGRPLVRGYFTRALLDALRGGASGAGGGVTASELKKYVERETRLLAKNDGRVQVPVIRNEMIAVDGEEPIFGRYPPRPTVEFHFGGSRRGPIALLGPDTREVKRWDVSQSPMVFHLSPVWLYALCDLATGEEKVVRVTPSQEMTRVDF
jgi:hypothetical protein